MEQTNNLDNSSSGVRPIALQAREKLESSSSAIRLRHASGEAGNVIALALSQARDAILLEIFQQSLEATSPAIIESVAMVLLGGSGRQEIAPKSDIDLMLLYQGGVTDELKDFSRRLSQDITDAGLKLGYSLRTVRDACSMSLEDAYIYSSLTEARFLVGNEELFNNFLGRFGRLSSRRSMEMIRAIVQAREQERNEFGETVYLLRPNIKRSRGGLRDVHLIRWLGSVQFGVNEIDELLEVGGISTTDSSQLKISLEFLLRVRNEMHFFAGRAEDQLGRNEQVRLAEVLGYEGSDAILSVEAFMRDYFRYTSRIRYICDHFVNKVTTRRPGVVSSLLESLVSSQIDDYFWMGPTQIGVSKASIETVQMDLEQVLRLMQLACLHNKKIEHDTWIAIRHAMLKYPEIPFTSGAARRFMALLSNTSGLADSLFRLHEMQVLSKIIPAFDHARGLMQFNAYHHYTVDEHSLRAVRSAISFEQESGLRGKIYRQLKDKNVLHLALLLHDLGKGFLEDHSDVGARIAEQAGVRLNLPDETIEDVKYLVQNHLVMSHLAFHRDINDPSLVAEFASNVGSLPLLSMLFLLTAADISAVAPGMLNPWKLSLLSDLYQHARLILIGDSEDSLKANYRRVHEKIASVGTDDESRERLLRQAGQLPISYCARRSHQQIAEELLSLEALADGEVFCRVRPIAETKLLEIVLARRSHRRSGIFYRLTGLLSGFGMQIQSADIKSLDDKIMFYWIQFEDPDFSETPVSRLQSVAEKATELAQGIEQPPPKFRKLWKKKESRAAELSRPKIRVKINNQTSDSATIIDVFAYDKTGLLYKISKSIYALGLDITYARISTYAHQIIDVFYVTDGSGNKIRNRNQIQIIRKELSRAITEFLEND